MLPGFEFRPADVERSTADLAEQHAAVADDGVLFLDELGDMPLALQSRLLRVPQEREVTALGSSCATPVDFAPIAASHHELAQSVEAQAFRAVLCYRIAQSGTHLRPLRERANFGQLVGEIWNSLGAPAAGPYLGDNTRDASASRAWPGNFRQLVGVLRTLIALSDPGMTIGCDRLPAQVMGASKTRSPAMASRTGVAALADIARDAMRKTLSETDGNTSEATRRLGVSRSTLYRRLRSSG